MNHWNGVFAAALAGAVVAAAVPASAESEAKYPNISGEVSFEIQGDFITDSDESSEEGHDVYTTTEPYLIFGFTPNLSVHAHFTLEPQIDRKPDDSRVFEDHGIFMEELFLNFETEDFRLYGGKFAPNFGIAWDATPGIYGTDPAEDGYEFSERIGVGGAVNFGNESMGNHSVSASVFFLDTALDGVWGQPRGDVELDDGGKSNTESLRSYAVGLDGEVPVVPNLNYHVAFIDQAKGRRTGDEDGVNRSDELGVVGGLLHEADLGDGFGLNTIIEIAHFWNADLLRDNERSFITGGAEITYENWFATVAYTETLNDTAVFGEEDFDDSQFQASLGYAFDFGLAAELAYRRLSTSKIDSNTIGFLISYVWEFGPFPE